MFAHETSCTRYWQCWNGTATLQQCPHSLLYNEQLHSCDWPQNVSDCQKHRMFRSRKKIQKLEMINAQSSFSDLKRSVLINRTVLCRSRIAVRNIGFVLVDILVYNAVQLD